MATHVLHELSFGKVDSESEVDLDKLFVRTGDFDKFVRDDIWLALGAKGTGKSALFELFTKHEKTARSMAGTALDGVVIAAGTGFGDLSEVATGDIQSLRDADASFDHDRLWRLYIAIKAGLALDSSFDIPRGPLKDLLNALGERRDFRVGPLLRELWELTLGAAPSEITVTAGGASVSLRGGKKSLDVVTLLSDVNSALEASGKRLWLLFDKVDEIWPANRDERKRALEGLFTAASQIRRKFPFIRPKILLRTDLWADLEFTNKDHLTDKKIELNWKAAQITTMLLKRAVSGSIVRSYVESRVPQLIGRQVEDLSVPDRENALMTIFPTTVYAGQREARTVDWIVERVTDGRNTVLPRDAIVLANYSKEMEEERGEEQEGSSLLSRESVREAFTKTSVTRCEAFLAEFPALREHFRRFSGQQTSEYSRAALLELMDGLKPAGEELIERLYEVGIILPNTGRILTAQSFEIPRLYRTGLGLVIRGRP